MTYGAMSSLLALACAIGLASPAAANPDGFPARPITLIVPFPAGSQPDTIARFVGQHPSSRVGVTVIQNRPGAGGTTGTKRHRWRSRRIYASAGRRLARH